MGAAPPRNGFAPIKASMFSFAVISESISVLEAFGSCWMEIIDARYVGLLQYLCKQHYGTLHIVLDL